MMLIRRAILMNLLSWTMTTKRFRSQRTEQAEQPSWGEQFFRLHVQKAPAKKPVPNLSQRLVGHRVPLGLSSYSYSPLSRGQLWCAIHQYHLNDGVTSSSDWSCNFEKYALSIISPSTSGHLHNIFMEYHDRMEFRTVDAWDHTNRRSGVVRLDR